MSPEEKLKEIRQSIVTHYEEQYDIGGMHMESLKDHRKRIM
ncbi:hypothetical protein LCGC14_2114980, partial [marine sediment metagenome]